MRLNILINGHRPFQKLIFKLIKAMMGALPGPIATLSYRRSFFGKHYTPWLQKSMRKTREWTKGEVEVIAAFTSKVNQCQYCVGDHIATARNAWDDPVLAAILEDYQTAPINEKMRETLRFIEKLTLTPEAMTQADLEPLRKAGVSDHAIKEAMHVNAVFNIINRLADSFNFEMSPKPEKVGSFLYNMGYGLASVPG